MTASIEIRDFYLSKGSFLMKNINLSVKKGERFALLGKTGAGKTMLLESMAGFYSAQQGEVLMDGVPVLHTPVEEREIGFVYQDYLLFPHMTVFDNIAFGLRMRKYPRGDIQNRVEEIAGQLSILHLLRRYPGNLSGGEQQRCALGRVLVLRPRVLLLDEPFTALDRTTKEEMYDIVETLHRQLGCTIVFVTHDFEEARRLSDRAGVMVQGELRCIRETASLFTASGDTEVDYFLGVEHHDSRRTVQ